MTQVYTAEYLANNEVLELQWGDDKFPDALQQRNTRARELRKQGWTVECKKWDFTDLARCSVYSLSATRQKTYTCDQVRAVGYTLKPLKCIFCGSLEVTFLQYVDGGSGYCEECGGWQ